MKTGLAATPGWVKSATRRLDAPQMEAVVAPQKMVVVAAPMPLVEVAVPVVAVHQPLGVKDGGFG